MRQPGWRSRAVDALFAVACLAVVVCGTTNRLVSWLPGFSVWLLAPAQAALVLARRRAPLAVLAATTALSVFMIATGFPGLAAVAAPLAAAYAVAVYGPAGPTKPGAGRLPPAPLARPAVIDGADGRGVLASLAAAAALMAANLSPGARIRPSDGALWAALSIGLCVVLAWVCGYAVRTRRAYVVQLEERARRLEREEGERAERAVADERLRIARELHDVIGHSISLITVQAEAAGRCARTRPEAVPDYLATISATSREALAEMRRVLAVLRPEDGEPLEPRPGLASLPELIAKVESAGVPVRLDVEPSTLPAGVGLAAYRIVQEALTNTLKYAGRPATASVTIARAGPMLHVCVVDDGLGPQSEPSAAAHGLVGMRERAAMYDGTLRAGRRRGGGFEVHATLRMTGEAP
ncbi:sensor histidine kinase [Microtetraspora fusca]|uniref:histidine kinase n=1 Tax=Microtetraspora fusca TaxID=1997 RepID=A0ABW6VBC3_MICFU